MVISLDYLQQCAAQSGFDVQTLEKVTRLGTLAAAISRHPKLGSALALKGGTALNLCQGGPPSRMSVDLDYNYVANAGRREMQADRPAVEEALETLARRLGFRLQRSAEAFAGRKVYAIYRSVLGPEDRVEIDLNFLWRQPLAGLAQVEMWQPGALDRPNIVAVSPLELAVGKLLAFLNRTAPRDVWDVARLPGTLGETLLTPRFRSSFIALSALLPLPLTTYTRALIEARLTPTVIEQQLVPMLAEGSPRNLDQLIDAAWAVVAPLINVTPQERAYVESIHEGQFRPELLLTDVSEPPTWVAGHPVVRWKLKNVRQRRQ